MKKIIIIVVALLVLGGGGFGAWKFFMAGDKAETAAAPEQNAAPVFMDLDPFVVSVIRDNRVVKYLSLTVKLEVAGPVAEAKVTKMMPYLRDAYMTRLHASLSRSDPALNYDVEKLKRQLMAESERVLGPGYVRNVLIGSIMEKRSPP